MLNGLWAGMMIVGILWAAAHGNMAQVTNGALDAAKEAVTLGITMLGVMSFWSGILEVGEKAGLITQLARRMKGILRFLFPRIPENHPALRHIATNMIANVLGLGWAATPAGLKAMEELKNLEEDRRAAGKSRIRRGAANNEMCTFLIVNISSLQLIPINMIAYRSQYGSVNPAAIVGAGILATSVSTGAAILFCRVMERKRRRV